MKHAFMLVAITGSIGSAWLSSAQAGDPVSGRTDAGEAAGKKRTKAARCGRGQLRMPVALRGRRVTIRPRGRRTVVRCVRPLKPGATRQRRHVAASRITRSRRLVVPRARRILRRGPRKALGRYNALDRIVRRHLGESGGRARASRARRTFPISQRVGPGRSASGTGTRVEPDPDEVGRGVGTDVTMAIDGAELPHGERARGKGSLRDIYYEGAFSKRCPAAGGKVGGDYALVKSDVRTVEVSGRRGVVSSNFKIDATFEGHVGEDARLVDFDLQGDFVLEIKAREEVAGTGKLLVHHPTRVYRGRFRIRALSPRGGGLGVALQAGRFGGGASGPKGASATAVEQLANAAVFAESGARAVLLEAEEYWYGNDDAIGNNDFGNCVRLAFDPTPVELRPGETKEVQGRLNVVEGGSGETKGNHRIRAITGAVEPAEATSDTGTPARIRYTAPNPKQYDGVFNSFKDVATSRRGRALYSHTAKHPDERIPSAYQGTVTGSRVEGDGGASNGTTETWTATNVRFERRPASPNGAPIYDLTGGTVQWTLSGKFSGDCTISDSRTFSLAGDSFDYAGPPSGQVAFSPGAQQYSAEGHYGKLVQDVPRECSGGNDTTLATPHPFWLDSRGEHMRQVSWTLSGSASSSDSSGNSSWQWELGAEF